MKSTFHIYTIVINGVVVATSLILMFVEPQIYTIFNVAAALAATVCFYLFLLVWRIVALAFRSLQAEQMKDGMARFHGKITFSELLGRSLGRFFHWIHILGYAVMTLLLLAISALCLYVAFVPW